MASDEGHFVARYLEPSERISELLFGLIMTLTFTLGAGLVIEEGPDATRELLVGVIGCNIAWGVIDGLLYVMNAMYGRGRAHRAASMLRKSGEGAATQFIRDEVENGVGLSLSEGTLQKVVGEVLESVRNTEPGRVKIQRDDIMGAIASFWLVFCTAIPAVVPFLLIDNHLLALRVSNFLLVGLMFVVGFAWAHFTNANRWLTGLGMVVFGLILVQATIMLGG